MAATTPIISPTCSALDSLVLGNGICNGQYGTDYNTLACGWDGGDCCEDTCKDTDSFTCGQNLNGAVIGYPQCNDPDACVVEDLARVGDGLCDAIGQYNTRACDWDGGDCCFDTCVSTANATCGDSSAGEPVGFPDCEDPASCVAVGTEERGRLGDSLCDPNYNNEGCGWDGGDCCRATCVSTPPYQCGNTAANLTIGFNDCEDPSACRVSDTSELGDGYCHFDADDHNTARCDWDGGDCCVETCASETTCGKNGNVTIGFTHCEDPLYQVVLIPPTLVNCTASPLSEVGNGVCDSSDDASTNLNAGNCSWDGGDCCPQTCTSAACASSEVGFDCQDPSVVPDLADTCSVEHYSYLADGYCDKQDSYNTEGCGWDGGDCCEDTCVDTVVYPCGETGYHCQDPSSADYLQCPTYVSGARARAGNGVCDDFDGSAVNNAACTWDGGDCCPSSCNVTGLGLCGGYAFTCLDPAAPEVGTHGVCDVEHTSYLRDGFCDFEGGYNTEMCGWDGGDCCASSCRSVEYTCGRHPFQCLDPNSTELEGYDGPCPVRPLSYVGDGYCDANTPYQNTRRCGWDGGDCCYTSCVNGPLYSCGYTYNNDSQLQFTGYDECRDPVHMPTTDMPTTTTTATAITTTTTTSSGSTTTTFTTRNHENSGVGGTVVEVFPSDGAMIGGVTAGVVVVVVVIIVVIVVVMKNRNKRRVQVMQSPTTSPHHHQTPGQQPAPPVVVAGQWADRPQPQQLATAQPAPPPPRARDLPEARVVFRAPTREQAWVAQHCSSQNDVPVATASTTQTYLQPFGTQQAAKEEFSSISQARGDGGGGGGGGEGSQSRSEGPPSAAVVAWGPEPTPESAASVTQIELQEQ